MKKTLIVNLVGGPGAGKTTTMAGIFNKLKCLGIDAEMVSEFAKELIYENRKDTMKDELYIFAKQSHRLICVIGKVDVIITDLQLILTVLFNHLYGKKSKELDALVISEFKEYENLNFFINRVNPYQTNGRNESEELSDKIAVGLEQILIDNDFPYITFNSDEQVVDLICDEIIKYMDKQKVE